MGSRRLPRLIAVSAAIGVIAFSTPAWAETDITVNPGNLGTTAAEWKPWECSPQLGGGPLAGKDIWVFNLPGDHDTTGDFVSLTITFSTPGGDVVKHIPGPDSGIVLLGHSKAWIAVPAGWTLTGASAVISGTASRFVLTHTCPASSGGASNPPGGPGGPGQPGGPGEPGGPGGPGLPVTGTAVTGLVIAGVLLAGAGTALVFLQRRRRTDVDDVT